MSVLQVTEDVLALFSQHVIHHIIGDMNISFGVLIMFSVVQLKNNIFLKTKIRKEKCKLFRASSLRVLFPISSSTFRI